MSRLYLGVPERRPDAACQLLDIKAARLRHLLPQIGVRAKYFRKVLGASEHVPEQPADRFPGYRLNLARQDARDGRGLTIGLGIERVEPARAGQPRFRRCPEIMQHWHRFL